MLRTASSLPHTGRLTLASDPTRFQTEPPACYRASWRLPGPDFHRQATTSLRTARNTMADVTVPPPALLGAPEHLHGHVVRAEIRQSWGPRADVAPKQHERDSPRPGHLQCHSGRLRTG